MTFAGLDYDSSAVHVALVDEDTGAYVSSKTYDLGCGPGDSFDRARRTRDLLPTRTSWADAGVLAVGIEATYSQAFKAAVALARVQGAILACLPRDLLVIPLPANHRAPAGWKALTVGRTNATKDDVREWALDQGCPEKLTQDLCDAYAIARATRHLWNLNTTGAAA